jgi:DNA modification methylase
VIIHGDCMEKLKELQDSTINCCVTSPPYYGLRDYGVNGQIGLEETPDEYISKLVSVFREVKRVLKDNGTLWLNIGDSYAGSGKGAAHYPDNVHNFKQATNKGTVNQKNIRGAYTGNGIKSKDLIGIPWMLAFALRADGWYLRQDIIWHKPNPMPESVTDRCTKAHEYIFLLSKSPHYYYDHESIKEPTVYPVGSREDKKRGDFKGKYHAHEEFKHISDSFRAIRDTRNKRDVWTISTKPYRGAHFATFPKDLIEPCILAGCPVGGTVLDCFLGSGTVGEVAIENQRNFIGIELNKKYCEMAKKRINNTQIKLELVN